MRRAGRAIAAGILLWLLAPPAAGQEPARATSCIACHEGLGGDLAAPVRQWRGSVHARNGITCAACHGGDPTLSGMDAMSPERGFRGAPSPKDVPAFCGRCHFRVMEEYLESAHGNALGAGGPQCATCHGAHAVVEPTHELINPERCTACHEYGRAGEIKSALIRTDQRILRLEEEIRGFRRVGYDTEDLANRLFQIRNEFHGLFHTVDVEKVRRHTDGFGRRLAELDRRIGTLRQVRAGRRFLGAFVVGALALLTVLLALLYLSYRREETTGSRTGPPAG